MTDSVGVRDRLDGMAKTICNKCHRHVVLTRIDGQLVAADPELISVVTAVRHGTQMAGEAVFARRIHSDRCDDYQSQARRDRIAADMRSYNKRNPKRNDGL